MKFVRFNGHQLGLLNEDSTGIIDLTHRLGFSTDDPLREYIENGYDASQYGSEETDYDLDSVTVEAPLHHPRKIVGAGRNYQDHVAEMSGTVTPIEAHGYFLKAPTSVIGPGGTIKLPFSDRRIDYELELAFILGEDVKDVEADGALDHVFGYTMMLDISMRGDEGRSKEKTTFRKGYDTFGPMGPVVVTPDEIPNPQNLDMQLEVNDELRQDSNTKHMIYSCDELLQFATISTTMQRGDVIMTGTPSGVSPLEDGDVINASIERIGSMELDVVARGMSYDDISTIKPIE